MGFDTARPKKSVGIYELEISLRHRQAHLQPLWFPPSFLAWKLAEFWNDVGEM
jgi:hypothetical protein